MKKYFICLILAVVINIGFLYAQDDVLSDEVNRKFTIQTSPCFYLIDLFSVGMGSFLLMDAECQYKINDLFNVSLTFSFLTFFYDKVYQIHLKPMFIIRPLKTGLKGFYISLFPIVGILGNGIYNYYYDTYEKEVYSEIGLGFNMGYKWIFKKGFTIQLGGGVGKTWVVPSKFYINNSFSSDGRIFLEFFDVNIDFKIGYSF
ncbi:MAG: hypothetical protein FWB73_05270 [Treponema sp.]|nr:hypothetical protein [Treponema sp.]